MDINTLAAWGEFLGGIAVVITLVYLVIQLRQTAKAVRSSTATATAQINFNSAVLQAQDPEMARIFWEGMADRSSLSEPDRRRYDPLMYIIMSGHGENFRLNRDGVFRPEEWESKRRELAYVVQSPGIQSYWADHRGIFDDTFGRFVDGMISEAQAAA
jgi:hypothetical protein